uniref:NADH-ubiquinone oxidoreductase chain 6 n=2 Tax=Elodes minuta TaxID=877997 RepID=A0A7D7FJT0_9COLE|nr:NADH dehydrogenase subunit 6 [Elodes minuta]QMP96564.1 NADH dehydrogenase subunit 6 [Elodes minuta]
MMYMFMINCLILNMIFISLNHPLSMGLILLIQTLSITILSSFMCYSFWMSYIIFLIMVGGMLILFIYMTSIVSNEKFKFSMKYSSFMMLISFLMISFLVLDKTFIYQSIKTVEMIKIDNINSLMPENKLMLNKIYNYPNNFITILLINYLLMTLIIVVKITDINSGPLRQKF